MIDLRDIELTALRHLKQAGAEGVRLGATLPVSVAIRLEMMEFATLTDERWQRAIVTRKGIAHLQRQVWA